MPHIWMSHVIYKSACDMSVNESCRTHVAHLEESRHIQECDRSLNESCHIQETAHLNESCRTCVAHLDESCRTFG